jgi:hypothetical protein
MARIEFSPVEKGEIEEGFVDSIGSEHFGKSPLPPLFQRGESKTLSRRIKLIDDPQSAGTKISSEQQ